jgi:hypothetical protein
MSDEEEGKLFQGKKLESFRNNASGAIRIQGADFTVVVAESGDVAIHYEQRTVRVAPGADIAVEWKHDRNDAPSPRSRPGAKERGSR